MRDAFTRINRPAYDKVGVNVAALYRDRNTPSNYFEKVQPLSKFYSDKKGRLTTNINGEPLLLPEHASAKA